jgi:hypothetical protein
MAGVAWERKIGFMHILHQIIRIIGFGIAPYLHHIVKIVLAILDHAQHCRDSMASVTEEEEGGEEEDHGNDNGNDHENEHETSPAAGAAGVSEKEEDEEERKAADHYAIDLKQTANVRTLAISRLAGDAPPQPITAAIIVIIIITTTAVIPVLISLMSL